MMEPAIIAVLFTLLGTAVTGGIFMGTVNQRLLALEERLKEILATNERRHADTERRIRSIEARLPTMKIVKGHDLQES